MLTNRKICSLLATLGLAWGLSPHAAQAVSWNTSSSPPAPNGTFTNGPGPVPAGGDASASYGNTYSNTTGGLTLNATSYYLTSSTVTSSTLNIASLQQYSAGLGVTSVAVGSALETVGSSPGHTVDNQGVYDLVVFELPSSGPGNYNYYLNQLVLTTFGTLPSNGDGDFTVFFGGDATANGLANVSAFKNITLGCLTATAVNASCAANPLGFTQQDVSSSGGTVNFNAGKVTGRYVIVAASLTTTASERNDDFKIGTVAGSKTTTKVPEPSTGLLLLGPAWFLMVQYRRRRTARC